MDRQGCRVIQRPEGGGGTPEGKCIKPLVREMAKGKIPFTESFPKWSFPVMGCNTVQLSQCYFEGCVKGNCFLGFHMTIPFVSLHKGSRKLNCRHFLTINSTELQQAQETDC